MPIEFRKRTSLNPRVKNVNMTNTNPVGFYVLKHVIVKDMRVRASYAMSLHKIGS